MLRFHFLKSTLSNNITPKGTLKSTVRLFYNPTVQDESNCGFCLNFCGDVKGLGWSFLYSCVYVSVMSSGAMSEAKMKNKSQLLKKWEREQNICLCVKSDCREWAEKPMRRLVCGCGDGEQALAPRNAQGEDQQQCGSVPVAYRDFQASSKEDRSFWT